MSRAPYRARKRGEKAGSAGVKPPKALAAFAPKPPSEAVIGRNVARFLMLALPPGWEWTHIPHGGLRDRATAGKLKAEGVRSGAPDYVITPGADRIVARHGPNAGDPIAVIWIELKAESGTLSDDQRRWRRALKAAPGNHWFLCKSDIEVEAVLRRILGVPLRATGAGERALVEAAERVMARDERIDASEARMAVRVAQNQRATPANAGAALIFAPATGAAEDLAENTAEPTSRSRTARTDS